jgi:hypothetical protein
VWFHAGGRGQQHGHKPHPPAQEVVVDDAVTPEEIEAESAVALPNKEVLSLLDVNANVDLGLDLAAPVDLAVAANLNVAAPIEAAASANLLSPGSEAIGLADQHGVIDQGISGSATATAPQHAGIDQTAGAAQPVATPGATTTGGVDSLLNGGSLLNADINIDANANLTAPIDGAIAANGNVAAPIDAAVAANIGSPDSAAEAMAPQDVVISQHLDNVSADATANQDATVQQ